MRFGSVVAALSCIGLAGTALFPGHQLVGVLASLTNMAVGGGLVAPSVTSYVSRIALAREQGAALGLPTERRIAPPDRRSADGRHH